MREVLPGKRRVVGVENVVIEEDLNPCEEIPPFGPCIIPVILESEKTPYLRSDHKEGVHVAKARKKRRKTTSQEKMRQVNVRFVEYVRFV